MIDPISYHVSAGKISYVILEFPPKNSRNYLVMQFGVGDIGRHNIYHITNNPYAPTVFICQHITKKTPEIVYLNLRKASVIRVMAILPNSRPSTGWRRGYLTNNCIKEFSMSAKLRYSRTATIKLWWQHLGAQLPGSLPHKSRRHQEQCSRHKTIGTIPRYPRDPKKISEIWGEERQNIYVRSPHQSDEGGRGVKRIPTLRYI